MSAGKKLAHRAGAVKGAAMKTVGRLTGTRPRTGNPPCKPTSAPRALGSALAACPAGVDCR
jgi:hypothetical protein